MTTWFQFFFPLEKLASSTSGIIRGTRNIEFQETHEGEAGQAGSSIRC